MPRSSKKKPLTKKQRFIAALKKPYLALSIRIKDFMSRRPHRSFRLTKRRDYQRSLKLPGYIAFTYKVNQTLWKNKRIFIWLIIFYAFFITVLVGIGSQETYAGL